MQRMRVGWRLLGRSWRLLDQDRELIALPVFGWLLTAGLFVGLFLAVFRRWPHGEDWRYPRLFINYPIFAVAALPATFANAAVIGAACERMNGGDPTIGSALGAAWSRRWRLVAWSFVGGFIGMLIQALLARLKVGRWVAQWTIGLAWQLAITFVVPVLMFEDRGPLDSLRRSTTLFRQRWGESVVGQGALAGGMALLMVPIMMVTAVVAAIVGATLGLVPMIVLIAVASSLLMGVFGALGSVYTAALYNYAVTAEGIGPFAIEDLQGAFRPKRSRRWFRRN